MSFDRPTLKELKDQAYADVRLRLGTEPSLEESVEGGLATAMAGHANGQHDHLDFVARQIFPETASPENLEFHAARKGLSRKPATKAAGSVSLEGDEDASLAQGVELSRADGALYVVTVGGVVATGVVTVPIEALIAGAAGECATGTRLSLASPVAGIRAPGTVLSPGLTGGANAESDKDLLTRLQEAERETADGGSAADYRRWALEADSQATRTFIRECYPHPSAVTVICVNDNATPPVPDSEALDRILAYIKARAPVTDTVVVRSPIPQQVDFQLALSPDTAATRAAVLTELQSLFKRDAKPGLTLPLSQMRTAIGKAVGKGDYVLDIPIGDAVAATYAHLPVLGTVQWL